MARFDPLVCAERLKGVVVCNTCKEVGHRISKKKAAYDLNYLLKYKIVAKIFPFLIGLLRFHFVKKKLRQVIMGEKYKYYAFEFQKLQIVRLFCNFFANGLRFFKTFKTEINY